MVLVKRFPVSLVAAASLVLLGLAGLMRGALPQTTVADSTPAAASEPIVAGGAYVREPAKGSTAAAYVTLYNTTATPDVLTGVESGAGASTTLRIEPGGGLRLDSGGLTIPAHGSVSLTPGTGHVAIEKLYGPLKAGQSVNFQLSFERSGQLLLTAPVIAPTAPAPTAAALTTAPPTAAAPR